MNRPTLRQSLPAELQRAKKFIEFKGLQLRSFIQERINGRHWFCIVYQDPDGTFYSINSKSKKWRVRKVMP